MIEATLYAIMSLISLLGLAVLALLYLDYWRDKRELELMDKRDEGWDECAKAICPNKKAPG